MTGRDPVLTTGVETLAFRCRVLTPEKNLRDARGRPAVRYLDDALVVVEQGHFTQVRPFEDARLDNPVRDLRPMIMTPGFVDTHVHFPQTRAIGRAGTPLLDWLSHTIFPEEARFREEGYARVVAREFTGYLAAYGTTTSCIFSSSDERATHVLFEALAASGLRAFAGLTLMDQACPEDLLVPTDEGIAACTRLHARWHGHDGDRLRFAVTPRFALSCSRRLMEQAARFANDHGLLIQTHVAENAAECAAVVAEHRFASDYLGVYEAVGLMGHQTLLAHAIHLSSAEWDRVAAHGARIAHCPDSNFFLGSGRMRLMEAKSREVRTGLGSDVGAGRTFNMRRAIAAAYDNALCVGHDTTTEELFVLSTLGGAHALGQEDVIGSVEEGKEADFLMLELPEHARSKADAIALLAFSDMVQLKQVFVRGKPIAGPGTRRAS